MWTCIRCKTELTTNDALPSIDSFGVYFMCPVCGRRNALGNMGSRRDPTPLAFEPINESD
jgi:hypothetical protein